MKPIKYIFLCGISLFAMVGCHIDSGKRAHFITTYIHLYNFRVGFNYGISDIHLYPDPIRIVLFRGSYGILSSGRLADFDIYSARYNDTSYNNYKPMPYVAVAEPIERISIVSDKDYDKAHPAGTPLDDIVKLRAESAYKFIVVNRYRWVGDPNDPDYGTYPFGYYPVNKYLNELTQEDLTLLGIYGFYFVFPEDPNRPIGETHTLTIMMTYLGEDLTTTCQYTF